MLARKRASRARTLLVGPARAFALQACILAAGFASGAALARSLTPTDRGSYQIVAIAYGLVAPVLMMGVGNHLSGRLAEVRPSDRSLAALVLFAYLVGTTCVLLLPVPFTVRLVVCALLWGPLLSPLTEAYYFRLGRADLVQNFRVLDVAGTSVGTIFLAAIGQLTLVTAAGSLLGVTCLLRGYIALRYLWQRRATLNISPEGSRVIVDAARRVWPWNLSVAAAGSADSLMASVFLTRPELGLYAVAGSIGRLALAPYSAVNPHVQAIGRGANRGARSLLIWIGAPTVLAVLGLFLFWPLSDRLVTLVYGQEYAAGSTAAAILLAANVLGGLLACVEAYCVGRSAKGISPLARYGGLFSLVAGVGALAAAGEINLVWISSIYLVSIFLTLILTIIIWRRPDADHRRGAHVAG